jgi:hypothetical protein
MNELTEADLRGKLANSFVPPKRRAQRTPEAGWRLHDLPESGRRPRDLAAYFAGRRCAQVWVTVSVNAEPVVFGGGAPYNSFPPFKGSPENEERRVCAGGLKVVENGLGPLGRAIAESEGNELVVDAVPIPDHPKAHNSSERTVESFAACDRLPQIRTWLSDKAAA